MSEQRSPTGPRRTERRLLAIGHPNPNMTPEERRAWSEAFYETLMQCLEHLEQDDDGTNCGAESSAA